jgi:Flp pilus assembly protein TadG
VLLLVPAAVLVLFVLGSISVDVAIAFMAQRELTGAAAAAANDAATAALSDATFYQGGPGREPGAIEIDDDAARRVAEAALTVRAPRGVQEPRITVVRAPGNQVCVVVTGRVDYIFAKAVPGASRGRSVTGRAVATAVGAEGETTVRRGDPDDVCQDP